jgi:hypothetical protein
MTELAGCVAESIQKADMNLLIEEFYEGFILFRFSNILKFDLFKLNELKGMKSTLIFLCKTTR